MDTGGGCQDVGINNTKQGVKMVKALPGVLLDAS